MTQNIDMVRILIAFVAGIASFLSPCVLPLVPGYISLISGVSIDGLKEGTSSRRAVIINSLAFNAGLSIIFLVLGANAVAVVLSVPDLDTTAKVIVGASVVLDALAALALVRKR